MLSDIEVAKQGIELVTCTHIIIVLQHVQRKALAEPARADEKKNLSDCSITGMNEVLST